MKIKVAIKKLDENAVVPTCGSEFAAGSDLYALCEETKINPGETVLVKTGIALELPEHTVGLICARSGIASKKGLAPANKVGVIDSDYRGEIIVALYNHSKEAQTISYKERIAQLLILPYYTPEFIESENLNDTSRASGGFGSTGK